MQRKVRTTYPPSLNPTKTLHGSPLRSRNEPISMHALISIMFIFYFLLPLLIETKVYIIFHGKDHSQNVGLPSGKVDRRREDSSLWPSGPFTETSSNSLPDAAWWDVPWKLSLSAHCSYILSQIYFIYSDYYTLATVINIQPISNVNIRDLECLPLLTILYGIRISFG